MRYGRWVLLVGLLCAPCWAGPLQKGVNLTLWSQDVNVNQLAASLDNLKALGANCVSVNVWWFQDDINSDVIQADFTRYSASDDSVRTVIAAIHERGMAAVLKPVVDLRNDPTHWRGNILGGEAWFTGPSGYGTFMGHWADRTHRPVKAAAMCSWRVSESFIGWSSFRLFGKGRRTERELAGMLTAGCFSPRDGLGRLGSPAKGLRERHRLRGSTPRRWRTK